MSREAPKGKRKSQGRSRYCEIAESSPARGGLAVALLCGFGRVGRREEGRMEGPTLLSSPPLPPANLSSALSCRSLATPAAPAFSQRQNSAITSDEPSSWNGRDAPLVGTSYSHPLFEGSVSAAVVASPSSARASLLIPRTANKSLRIDPFKPTPQQRPLWPPLQQLPPPPRGILPHLPPPAIYCQPSTVKHLFSMCTGKLNPRQRRSIGFTHHHAKLTWRRKAMAAIRDLRLQRPSETTILPQGGLGASERHF